MNLSEDMLVRIDLDRPGIPYTASVLQPRLFRDGNSYCCVLGPDPQRGVFGCGDTPEEAIQDWDKHLHERISGAAKGDELVSFVNETLRKRAGEEVPTGSAVSGAENKNTGSATIPVAGEARQSGNETDDLTARKNSTNQSNIDGSEYI